MLIQTTHHDYLPREGLPLVDPPPLAGNDSETQNMAQDPAEGRSFVRLIHALSCL